MPGKNGQCENEETVAVSARMEERQNGKNDVANKPISENGSTTANEITIGTEEKNDEGKIRGEQNDIKDSYNSRSGACDRAMVRDFPQFAKAASPTFKWVEVDGETFAHSLECYYKEIVDLRTNLFKVRTIRKSRQIFCSWAD